MRIARLFAACFALCVFAGPAVSAESGPPEDVAAVKAFGDTWISFYEAGDVDGLLGLYEPDAWLMTRDQPAKIGHDAIRSFFEQGAGSGATVSMVFDYEDVTIEGDWAFLTSKWWLTAVAPGAAAPFQDAGRSFIVFKRGEDGAWRVWRDIDNHTPDVAVGQPPADAD